MGQATVSVVIPTFNRATLVGEAVDSALAQTYAPAEVIVVDDGSTDDTAERLARYEERIQFVAQPNGGPSAARNTGIRRARSRYVAFLDSDDLWRPEKLDAQMRLFANDPSLGVVSCLAQFTDLEGRQRAATNPAETTLRAGDRTSFRRLLLRNFVSGGSNAVVRRDCFDVVGLFDEGLVGVEDWDMWLRMARKYAIGFVNEPLTITRAGTANLSAQANVSRMLENELRLLTKHFADESSRIAFYDRGMALSERYGRAALVHFAIGNPLDARRCILKALRANPVHVARRKAFVGLLLRSTMGERTFGALRRMQRTTSTD